MMKANRLLLAALIMAQSEQRPRPSPRKNHEAQMGTTQSSYRRR
jgi:hypothetical protein